MTDIRKETKTSNVPTLSKKGAFPAMPEVKWDIAGKVYGDMNGYRKGSQPVYLYGDEYSQFGKEFQHLTQKLLRICAELKITAIIGDDNNPIKITELIDGYIRRFYLPDADINDKITIKKNLEQCVQLLTEKGEKESASPLIKKNALEFILEGMKGCVGGLIGRTTSALNALNPSMSLAASLVRCQEDIISRLAAEHVRKIPDIPATEIEGRTTHTENIFRRWAFFMGDFKINTPDEPLLRIVPGIEEKGRQDLRNFYLINVDEDGSPLDDPYYQNFIKELPLRYNYKTITAFVTNDLKQRFATWVNEYNEKEPKTKDDSNKLSENIRILLKNYGISCTPDSIFKIVEDDKEGFPKKLKIAESLDLALPYLVFDGLLRVKPPVLEFPDAKECSETLTETDEKKVELYYFDQKSRVVDEVFKSDAEELKEAKESKYGTPLPLDQAVYYRITDKKRGNTEVNSFLTTALDREFDTKGIEETLNTARAKKVELEEELKQAQTAKDEKSEKGRSKRFLEASLVSCDRQINLYTNQLKEETQKQQTELKLLEKHFPFLVVPVQSPIFLALRNQHIYLAFKDLSKLRESFLNDKQNYNYFANIIDLLTQKKLFKSSCI